MSSTSYITGCGLVSALGPDLPSTWAAMVAGEFIRDHARAKLEELNGSRADWSHQRPVDRTSRVARLAAQAAKEAIARAGWSTDQLLDESTAIVFGTSKGDITDWINHGPKSDNHAAGWSDSNFGLARVATQLCDLLGRPAGVKLTLSAACASGLHALIRADLMLRSGQVDRVLVVAAEASVHPLFLASFARLGVVATGDEPGRPFDINRSGFRMSEAAAAVTLEHSPAGGIAITHTAMAGDAQNIVAGDPSGESLKRMLAQVAGPGSIDVIHAHGTGTMLNDKLEADAIESVWTDRRRPVCIFSHKGALGHSLGASGLVSAVLAYTAQQTGQLPPMATTLQPMRLRSAHVHSPGITGLIQNSVILASGFGGPQTLIQLQTR